MDEERILYRGSPSVVTRFGPLFIGCLVLLGSATVAAVLWGKAPPLHWILAGVAVLAAVYMAVIIALVKSTVYEVTTERLRVRQGILTKRTDEAELYRANDTSLIEPITMRMLGLGTIEIKTLEPGMPLVYLEAIRGARAVREDLRKHIEICRDRKRVRVAEFDNPELPPKPGS